VALSAPKSSFLGVETNGQLIRVAQHDRRPTFQLSQSFQLALATITSFAMDAIDYFAEFENLRCAGSPGGQRRFEAAKVRLEAIHKRYLELS
jgi:hypothetical protein